MDSPSNPDLVTPALTYDTGIPVTDNADAETITVSFVSEFKQHSIPATAVDATHKVFVALDGHNQPLVFAVGNDSRLYCIRHIHGDRWTSLDITPGGNGAKISTFGAFQHNSGKVAIGAAVKTSDSTYPHLYYAAPVDAKASSFKPSDISFAKIKDKSVLISSITISGTDLKLDKHCFIIVGTHETDSKRGTDYKVSTDPNESDPWKTISLPEQATAVLQVISATQRKPILACAVSLYKKKLSTSSTDLDADDVGSSISCLSLDGKYNISVLLDKLGKGARDMSTAVTSKGLSDLYVAGVKGIGYYASQVMDKDPTVILPDIAFKQVVASESDLKVSILATSTSGGLYYIEGTRESTGVVPTFKASGFSIRQDVGTLSTQYNAAINAAEAIYVNANNQLRHIWRDPGTKLWSEQAIHIPHIDGMVSYPAFVSQLHLKGSSGAMIMDGRQVMLSSSEVAYVHVNEKSYRLDSTPVPFSLDVTGYLDIVVQANNGIAAPTIKATIKGTSKQYSFNIEPRQRLLRQWSKVSSGNDLKNAKSTARAPVFPNTKIDDSTFAMTASVLTKVPMMVGTIDSSASPMTGSTTTYSSSTTMSLISKRTGDTLTASTDDSWMKDAKNLADDVGDFLESIWHGFEKVARFGIKIAAGVVDFFAEIRGKVVRFTLDAIGILIRSVSSFLKDALGIDITRFLALFGFVWDYENILKTQKIIVQSAVKGASVIVDMLKVQSPQLKDYMRDMRTFISLWIRVQPDEPDKNTISVKAIMDVIEDSPITRLISQIIHNPIIQELQRYASLWLCKIVSLLDDVIVFPGLGDLKDLITDSMKKLLDKLSSDATDDLVKLLQDVFNKIVDLISGTGSIGDLFSAIFSDMFWSFFGAAEDIVDALVDILPELMTCAVKILTSAIKLPGTSKFWETLTGTPFSFVDVGSMIVAQITYLITMMWKEKLPFEAMDPWYNKLPANGSSINLSTNVHEHGPAMMFFANRSFAAASDPAAAADPPVPMDVWLDLMFNFGVSLGTFGSSLCTLWGDLQRVANRSFPYRSVPNQPSQVSPPGESTAAGKLTFQSGEQIFALFGLVCECCVLANTTHLSTDSLDKYFTIFTRMIALLLKSLSLTFQIYGNGTLWTDLATPLANIFNSLPGGIWSYEISEKKTQDKIAVAVAWMNALAGGCDMATMALCQAKKEDWKLVPFAASTSLNGVQGISALYYGVKYAV